MLNQSDPKEILNADIDENVNTSRDTPFLQVLLHIIIY